MLNWWPYWVSPLSLSALDHTLYVQLCFYMPVYASSNLSIKMHSSPWVFKPSFWRLLCHTKLWSKKFVILFYCNLFFIMGMSATTFIMGKKGMNLFLSPTKQNILHRNKCQLPILWEPVKSDTVLQIQGVITNLHLEFYLVEFELLRLMWLHNFTLWYEATHTCIHNKHALTQEFWKNLRLCLLYL